MRKARGGGRGLGDSFKCLHASLKPRKPLSSYASQILYDTFGMVSPYLLHFTGAGPYLNF